MCSGCFGEYEEDDEFERPTRGHEQGSENDQSDGRSAWQGFSREELEILVSAERIVEIRYISAGRPRHIAFANDAPGADTPQGTREHCTFATAKNYQTSWDPEAWQETKARGSSKWLLFIGLALVAVAALGLWVLR